MRKIAHYQLISETTVDDLNEAVAEALDEAFEPFASPFYADEMFHQAVVRYTEEAQ